jgi:hypothetical protein
MTGRCGGIHLPFRSAVSMFVYNTRVSSTTFASTILMVLYATQVDSRRAVGPVRRHGACLESQSGPTLMWL